MTKLSFSDRPTYLQWRSDWRKGYADLSIAIRDLKTNMKNTMRSNQYAGKIQFELACLQIKADDQIKLRMASKEEANRQYLASKNGETR